MQPKLHVLLSTTLLVLFSFLSVFAFGQTTITYTFPNIPTVSSDKDDYAPGEVAIIRGTGWTLDQYVDVHIEEDPTQIHVHDYHNTKVNPDGTWEIKYPIEERHLGVKFTVIVEGKQSGYESKAYFTDSRSDYTSTLSKTEVCSGTEFTLTLKNVSNVPVGTGNTTNRTISSFKVLIPGGVTLVPESISGWTISTTTLGEIRYSTSTNPISSGNSIIVPLKGNISTNINVILETKVYTSNNFTSNTGAQPEFILTDINNVPLTTYPQISILNVPTANLSGSATINSGDNATLNVALLGDSPWSLVYSNGTTNSTINNIISNPFTFTVSPTTNTTYTLISLSDANCSAVAGGLTGSATITVNANQSPSLNAIGPKNIDELQTLSFTATASDENVPGLSYSLQGTVPDGASITATGAFSWTPTEAQDGSHTFTVKVTDNGSPALSDEEEITVTVSEVNVAPVLAAIGNKSVNELVALSFTASATDADLPANTLTYTLVGAPSGASIDAATGAFSWTPTEAQDGSHTFTVKVTDNGSPALSDEEEITVTVSEVNVAPVLAAIGNKSVNELVALSFTASATDADLPANTLTYTLVGAPSGASIDAATGAFSWTPTEAQDGSHTFTVKVTDNGSPALSDEEEITVTVSEVNVAPSINTIANQEIPWGNELSIAVLADDADIPENNLTYSLVGTPPSGSGINLNTGVFTWTPGASQIGNYIITVRVTDDGTPSLFTDISFPVKVVKRKTKMQYQVVTSVPYSDNASLSATLLDITNSATGDPIAGKVVNFTIGAQSVSDADGTNSNGLAQAEMIVVQDPGPTYKVKAAFTEDAHYLGSFDEVNFDILQENATIEYTGVQYASTPNTTTCKVTVLLRATVTDSKLFDSNDPDAGDITKATVTFKVYNLNGTTPIATISNVPVSALDNTKTVGIASTPFEFDICNVSAGYEIFKVEVEIGGSYYSGDKDVDNVNISKPMNDFITGGGHTIATQTSGKLAATLNSKVNFGFNVKWNKTFKNPQGNMNIIVRKSGRIYQIKANQMSSLAVSGTACARVATFIGKANVQDITTGTAQTAIVDGYSIPGGLNLEVTMSDNYETGKKDMIGITLWDGNTLVFSNNWMTSKTVEKELNGGNLTAHNGLKCATEATPATQQVVTEARSEVIEPLTREFQLKAFPNPSVSHFNVQVSSDKVGEKINVRVLDLYGRTVEVIQGVNSGQTLRLGGAYRPGIYFVEMIQGAQRQQIKLMKQGD